MARHIVFEGLDGGGKDTTIALVQEWLEDTGRTVFRTRQPTDHPVGQTCRGFFDTAREIWPLDSDRAAFFGLMMMADMLHHDHVEIKHELALHREYDKHWILQSRSWISTWCYQAKCEGIQTFIEKELIGLHRITTPQVVVFLKAPVDVCLERIRQRGEGFVDAFERREVIEQVQSEWDKLKPRLTSAGLLYKPIHVLEIDTSENDPQQVLLTVQKFLSERELIYGT
jgi:dTMP kinase